MKLDGVRVLDLSLFLPGPYLTQMMADHGAEVIKIEPPGGEPVRNVGYRTSDGVAVWFRNTHRNKKSVVLNLKDDADRESFLALADTADVLVEAFRPGVVERLGIGPKEIRARNPGIVYVSIAAFGQTGPEVKRPAHDLAIQALAGTLSLNLGRDGAPANPGMPVADVTGSMVALAGVLMALYRREKTGRGDYLDVAMMDSLMSWLPNVTGPVFAEDRAPVVKDERSFGGYAFFTSYQTKDGKYIALGGVERKFVVNFLNALERPDLIEIAAGPNGPSQEPVKAFLREAFAQKSRAEWEEFIRDLDVCAAPVLDIHEAFHSAQAADREMLVTDADGNLHIGTPLKFSDEPGRLILDLPELGEHTEEVLAELRERK
ncbi:CaiB/BaiF CoA transferase family protein [Hoeflea sp.]|uniref:CaiB/BaiF CoA transferase family protein n=1 Tax=Hoeflea sp. TaxID=1940281 RepID=UPI003B02964D